MKIFPPYIHKWLYFFGLSVVAVGMPLSEFLMSVGQFIIFGNWLLEGKIPEKLNRFWKNKIAVLVGSVMLLHLIGLLYTSDIDYAFKDIRIKVPILLLPLVMASTEPLSRKVFNWLMAIFIASVTVGTFISMCVYYGIIHTKYPISDIRDISIFISHIRFSLMICVSVFFIAWYLRRESSIGMKLLFFVLFGWLVFFLIFLDSLTGIVVLVVATFIISLHKIFTSKRKQAKVFVTLGIIGIATGIFFYLKPLVEHITVVHPIDFSKLNEKTPLGNIYEHNINSNQTENGYHVWTNVCWYELEQSWKNRSKISFSGKNKRGGDVKFTLIRYLTSKNLRKDAASVQSLSDEEIKVIEAGIPNINYVGRMRITVRIMETLWEFKDYKNGGDIDGHSSAMRLEFWRAGWNIFKDNPVIGVGTGDIKNAYAEEYIKLNSQLDPFHRLRSHNQYLSIAVAFGIIGLTWFIISLVYPFVRYKMWNNYFYFVFFLIAVLSFINEDTLETQPGVTFFAFFNALLLFGVAQKSEPE